jgi:hypothetical protein
MKRERADKFYGSKKREKKRIIIERTQRLQVGRVKEFRVLEFVNSKLLDSKLINSVCSVVNF